MLYAKMKVYVISQSTRNGSYCPKNGVNTMTSKDRIIVLLNNIINLSK